MRRKEKVQLNYYALDSAVAGIGGRQRLEE
jgi:hypothetical protein